MRCPFSRLIRIACLFLWISGTTFQELEATGREISNKRKTVFNVAEKQERPVGAPLASDVLMRTLNVHPGRKEDPHNTLESLDAFHVTRLEWSYALDKDFIAKVKKSGRSFGGTAASQTVIGVENLDEVSCVDLNGKPVTASWMRKWSGPGVLWGCSNIPAYEQGYLDHLKKSIDAGADSIQRDGPRANELAVAWGGCFCEHCMKGFRKSLDKRYNNKSLRDLGIRDIDSFDYREHLRDAKAPLRDGFGSWDGGKLKEHFKEFQKQSVYDFYLRMQKAIDEYAGRHVPFSCNNNARRFNKLEQLFDWYVGELSERSGHASPAHLHEITSKANALGASQVLTMPQRITYENEETWEPVIRNCIAMTYACGGHVLVPWDNYMPGYIPRYFGKPEQYADLYGFIRSNKKYLDGFVEVAVAGNGLKDKRYGDQFPVTILDSEKVSAIVRVNPKYKSGAVIHLVDWAETPSSFKIKVMPRRFFKKGKLRYTLLTPTDYNESAHKKAEKTGDYSALTKSIPINSDSTDTLSIPALHPWGLLVISRESKTKND